LTRYLKTCRIVGLAGLMSLALSALPAAPGQATVVCPPGTANSNNSNYCTVVTLSVDVIVQGEWVTVTINVAEDPHLNVTLLRHRRTLGTLFDGDTSGMGTIGFPKPTDPGTYEVKAVATANGVTTTVVEHFRIKKHKEHRYYRSRSQASIT
jgi:hypothetical protein